MQAEAAANTTTATISIKPSPITIDIPQSSIILATMDIGYGLVITYALYRVTKFWLDWALGKIK
jgi:hypothetical protein